MEPWRRDLCLAHHGIKGQRWGIRRGPPYPLKTVKRSPRKSQDRIKGPLDKYIKVGKMKAREILKARGKERLPAFKMKSRPVENTAQSIKEDLAAVNPSKNKDNCVFCSIAYDMRRRGYDVIAREPKETDVYSIYDVSSWYKKPKIVEIADTKDTKDAYDWLVSCLSEYGEGARGMVTGLWNVPPYKYGHAIAWQVFSGKVEFLDGQTNGVYAEPYEDV